MAERDIYTINIEARNQNAVQALDQLKSLAQDVEKTADNMFKETGNKRVFADLVRQMTEVQSKYTELKSALDDEVSINAEIELDPKSTQAMKDRAKDARVAIERDMKRIRQLYTAANNKSVNAFRERERETGQRTRVAGSFANYQNEPNRTQKDLISTQRIKRDINSQTTEALRIGRGAISSRYINNSNASRYEAIYQDLLSEETQGASLDKVLSGQPYEVSDNSLRGRLMITRDEAQDRLGSIQRSMEEEERAFDRRTTAATANYETKAEPFKEVINAAYQKQEKGIALTSQELDDLAQATAGLEKETSEYEKILKSYQQRHKLQMDNFQREFKAAEKTIQEVASSLDALDNAAEKLSAQMEQIQAESITQKADRDTAAGRISERASAIGLAVIGATAYAVASRFSRGKQRVDAIREDSLNVGFRTGDYDFRGIRQDFMEQGAPQGWKGTDMMAFSDSVLNSLGYIDQDNMRGNMQAMMDFAKFSGAGRETSDAYMETLYRSGAITTQEQAKAIQEGFIGAIKASGMEGREREQLEALTAINENMSRGREMSEQEVRNRTAMAAVLSGTGDRAFQGQNLADFNIGADEAIKSADPFSALGMLLGVGSDPRFAGEHGMYEMRRMRDEGLTPENFNTIIENATSAVGSPENVAVLLQEALAPGTSVESLKNLVEQYPDGLPIDAGDEIFKELGITGGQELDTRQSEYMDSADQTRQAQEAYMEKLESLLNDNKWMDMIYEFRLAVDKMGSQSPGGALAHTAVTGLAAGIGSAMGGIIGTTIGTAIPKIFGKTFGSGGGGGIGSMLAKMFSGGTGGTPMGPSMTGQLPNFAGDAVTGGTAKGIGGKLLGGATTALGGVKMFGGNVMNAWGGGSTEALTGMLGEKGMSVLSKGAPLLAAAHGAYKVSQADDKIQETGKQVGGIASGFGGAKVGAAIGTAIAPGIGTAIGGALGFVGGRVAGSSIGEWLGGKVSGFFGRDKEPEPEVKVKSHYVENENSTTSQEEKATTSQRVHAEQIRSDNIAKESENLSLYQTILNDVRRLLQISAKQNGIIGHLTGLSGSGGTGGIGKVGDGEYWSDTNLVKHDLATTSNQLTAEDLNNWINSKAPSDSVMRNMGEAFMEAGRQSGLDPRYLVAHAAIETGWGTSRIAREKGNMYGIGAFDASPFKSAYGYDNVTAGIIEGAKWIKRNYYDKGNTDLDSMHKAGYATDPEWANKIAATMRGAERHTAPNVTVNTTVNYEGTGNPERDGAALANGINNRIAATFRQERLRV